MVQHINSEEIVDFYMAVLPSIFAFVENKLNKRMYFNRMKQLVQNIRENRLFSGYDGHLRKWENRFSLLYEKRNPVATTSGTNDCQNCDFCDRIGYLHLDYFISFDKWLRYHKLHKYTYFFSNLTMPELDLMDEISIYDLELKVDLIPITVGARGTILRKVTEELHSRRAKLLPYVDKKTFQNPDKTLECLTSLKKILHTPLLRTGRSGELKTLLNRAILTVTDVVLNGIHTSRTKENAEKLVKVLTSAWSCSFFSSREKFCFNEKRETLENMIENGQYDTRPETEIDGAVTQEELLEAGIRDISRFLETLQDE